MIPKIIHQTSRTKNLSSEEERLRRRIRRIMPDWQLNIWDDADNLEIVRKFFPAEFDKFNSLRRGVVKADIARCVYLFAYGGLYIDTDYKILKPIDDEILSHQCVLPVSRSDDQSSPEFRICNSVMLSMPSHPFLKAFLGQIFSCPYLEKLPENLVEKVTGPEGLTKFYLENKSSYPDIYVPPRKFFHPLITMKGLSYDHRYSSYGAHLCWGSWRSKGLLRNAKTYLTRKISSF
jgi:mannosyltransferase OCH1-like enzyme